MIMPHRVLTSWPGCSPLWAPRTCRDGRRVGLASARCNGGCDGGCDHRRDNPDVILVVEDLPRGQRRRGASPGREVAHLALDGPGILAAAAALGGHREDLDEDELNHPVLLRWGKTPHETGDAAARSAPCG